MFQSFKMAIITYVSILLFVVFVSIIYSLKHHLDRFILKCFGENIKIDISIDEYKYADKITSIHFNDDYACYIKYKDSKDEYIYRQSIYSDFVRSIDIEILFDCNSQSIFFKKRRIKSKFEKSEFINEVKDLIKQTLAKIDTSITTNKNKMVLVKNNINSW